jgi:hypothetical protein
MSAMSEDGPPTNPLDSPYAPRRPSGERAEPRLATVSDAAFARTARLDTLRPASTPGDRLETAMSEFVRRQIRPEPVPVPSDFKREGKRRMWAAGVIGVAGAVAIASAAALLFVNLFPREKDAIQSFAAAVPPASSLFRQAGEPSKPPFPQVRGLVTDNNNSGPSATHEQSERLLQQFVQWRQKAALTDKP